MGKLIKAEFRKIVTTRLWWALLVPAVVLAFGWAWLAAAFFTDLGPELSDTFGDRVKEVHVSWAALGLTRGMNFATLFPMIFGALALSSEINRKTITTSFLTAPNRASLLAAKAITYAVWGALFGVIVAGAASLGTLGGADSSILPGTKDWLLILASGVLACVLWTLLGMGVGALLGSTVGTLVLLLVYASLVGPLSEFILTGTTETHVAGWMPNGSANGMTGATASALLFDQLQQLIGPVTASNADRFDEIVRFAAGAPGAYSLWASAAIFLAWTLLFFVTGLVRNQRRDIT
jgi:ABC-2 type transport system permease protein